MISRRLGLITVAVATAVLLVAAAPSRAQTYDDRYDARYERHERRSSYNDEYIFSTTKMVADWDLDPALKVPLFPPAVVIDVVFLPAEVIAGFF
jgi:hypothetical protein